MVRGRVWQEGVCGKREGVVRGRVWQEGVCGKMEGVARERVGVVRGRVLPHPPSYHTLPLATPSILPHTPSCHTLPLTTPSLLPHQPSPNTLHLTTLSHLPHPTHATLPASPSVRPCNCSVNHQCPVMLLCLLCSIITHWPHIPATDMFMCTAHSLLQVH